MIIGDNLFNPILHRTTEDIRETIRPRRPILKKSKRISVKYEKKPLQTEEKNIHNRKLTDKDIKDIRNKAADMSRTEIAKEYGLERQTVSLIVLNKYRPAKEITWETKKYSLSEQDIIDIRRRIAEKQTLTSLSKEYKVSISTISRIKHRTYYGWV